MNHMWHTSEQYSEPKALTASFVCSTLGSIASNLFAGLTLDRGYTTSNQQPKPEVGA